MKRIAQGLTLILFVGLAVAISQATLSSAAGAGEGLPPIFAAGNIVSPNSRFDTFQVIEVKGQWVRAIQLESNGGREGHEVWINPVGVWTLAP